MSPAPRAPASPLATCPNCGAPLAEPRPRFCGACGQETHVRPPRLGEFLQQFAGAYFATEGALWRTLRLLLARPGELTRQYLAGRRKHYVLPLRLYLSISLITLLLLRVLGAGDLDVKTDAPDEIANATRNVHIELGGSRAGRREGVFYCENLPDWVCKRIQRRIDIDPKAMVGEATAIKERFLGNLGGAMFALLPSFALWLQLAYWNRRLHYTEHLVFALHLHAFWFLALAVALCGVPFLSGAAALAVPVYGWLALRRVYGGRWWTQLLRVALIGVLYTGSLILALAGVALWSFMA